MVKVLTVQLTCGHHVVRQLRVVGQWPGEGRHVRLTQGRGDTIPGPGGRTLTVVLLVLLMWLLVLAGVRGMGGV